MPDASEHPEDVRIGEDAWIRWSEPDTQVMEEPCVDLDFERGLLAVLWRGLEVHCVRECCGLQALDLRPESITLVVDPAEARAVHSELAALRREITQQDPPKWICVKGLNQLGHPAYFGAILDHLMGVVSSVENAG